MMTRAIRQLQLTEFRVILFEIHRGDAGAGAPHASTNFCQRMEQIFLFNPFHSLTPLTFLKEEQ